MTLLSFIDWLSCHRHMAPWTLIVIVVRGCPSSLVVPCCQWIVIRLVATLLREISARQRGWCNHLGRQNTTGSSPSDVPLSRRLASLLHGVPSTSPVLIQLVMWHRFWWLMGNVGGWRLMWAVVATVAVVMGNGGQVSWLMVVWGRGKKFVFVLGYEGCLYLVKNCICIWLQTSVETGYTSLLLVFMVFKFQKSWETKDQTAVAVFDSPGNFQSWAVLVQSSLSLFPVLGLDFQALTIGEQKCSTRQVLKTRKMLLSWLQYVWMEQLCKLQLFSKGGSS